MAKCYKSFENSNSIFNLSYFWKNDENDAVVDATVKEFPVSNDNILDKLVFLKSNKNTLRQMKFYFKFLLKCVFAIFRPSIIK